MTKRVVILGALSAVAVATARRYAASGASLALAARRTDELEILAVDLRARGAALAATFMMDLARASDPAAALDAMIGALGGVDVVVVAYGVLTDQDRAIGDLAYARDQLEANFTSAALWSLAATARLEAQDSGTLVAIGSVAGDRGRQSNFVYGAAKAGLATLVQGLAHRLAAGKARAVIVKPGFIDTPMTAHLPKGGPLWAKPDAIAGVIVKAAEGGGPVVYAPWFWRFILLIIRLVPAPIFHKTRL
jgi:decaprenylphospho-beta-D-erythro-pentofuranosid-2-ulose 2-reductase